MASIGKTNILEVVKFVDFGCYVNAEQYGEVLLPTRYMPPSIEEGSSVEVFLYLDSEDRLIATTETPYTTVGQFALLAVKESNRIGAFLDWGLPKDLFVPHREQLEPMQAGNSYWVYVYIDDKTERIVATSKISKYLSHDAPQFAEGDKVQCLVHSLTERGYVLIVQGSHWGIIYSNELFEKLDIGSSIEAYVHTIRDDFKIDLRLQKSGFIKTNDSKTTILQLLQASGGFLPLHDKSLPEEIYAATAMSKKTFKMTIGMLYKEGYISIEPQGIRLR